VIDLVDSPDGLHFGIVIGWMQSFVARPMVVLLGADAFGRQLFSHEQ
jgi:hypothetical protein